MVHLTSLIHVFYGVWTQASCFEDGLFTLPIKEEHTFAVCSTGVFVTLSRQSRKSQNWERQTGKIELANRTQHMTRPENIRRISGEIEFSTFDNSANRSVHYFSSLNRLPE